MSEVNKPVEEQVAAAVEATPVVEPTTTETKAEETTTPAVTETAAAAEPPKDVVEPVAAATTETPADPTKAAAPKKEFTGEGSLGYKAPGGFIKKFAGFQKKWFWLGTEPVEPKNLSSYLRGEKQDVANHNAAWSSHTGKGLLYFSKHTTEKASPAGIINLTEISDIVEDGTSEFYFHIHGLKHVFQASTPTDRENWVTALKTKSAEGKDIAEEVKASDAYKEHHSSLSKSAAVVAPAAAAANKDTEAKKEEKAEAKEEKKEEKARKSRSASRKRNSIFGGFGLGSKKEEQTEQKEDKKTEAKETTPTETVTTEATPAPAPSEEPAVPVEAVVTPAGDEPAKTDALAAAPTESARPAAASKRNSSIFGTLSSKFGQKKSTSDRKASSEAAPEVPAKDAVAVEPVSAEAPVIPAPETSEPLAAAVESPAVAPTTKQTSATAEAEEPKPEVKPETKTEVAQKRKSSLPFGFGSKEKTTEVDGEKPKSSFAKLRQTIKGRSSPRAAEKAPEKAAEKTEEKAVEPVEETPAVTSDAAATTTDPVVSEPLSAAHQPSTTVSATA